MKPINLKWVTFLAVVVFLLITPLAIQADDEGDAREHIGQVSSRPDGRNGTWVIGDKAFEATERTEFKEEKGPLAVGACAKVKYYRRDDRNYAVELNSAEAEKCGGRDDRSDGGHSDEDRHDEERGEGGDGGDGLPAGQGEYVVVGWNDLGMHCMDPSFEDFAVLPPYNTLWAQVIRRGQEPQIVTEGVTVEYSIIDNTDSASKTNFWDYAQQLFNLPEPLPPNIGLAGFGLSGEMHPAGDHFAAEGIPLTEYRDSDPTTPYPYQLAELVAKDSNGNVLATTQTVAPVSTEMHCEYCHADNGRGNPDIATGVLKQNILTLHDQQEGTTLMAERPVLCAGCHGSNALNLPGQGDLPSLSLAMHGQHQTETNDCYQCHPGPQTQCLRGTMAAEGMTCQDCHGNMSDVANPARNPWLDEPRCETCHGSTHGEDPGALYRFSTGHGGVYCQACHGSQHAIYPTMQPNDNLQSIMLQGEAGTVEVCTVCHTNTPAGVGPHGEEGEGEVERASEWLEGDINRDGLVDMLDLVLIVTQLDSDNFEVDLNGDGLVDIADVSVAASHYEVGRR